MSTVKLPAGKTLVITTNSLNTGSYYRLADVNYSNGDAPTSIAVSTSVTKGPYLIDSHWQIDGEGVSISFNNPDLGTQVEVDAIQTQINAIASAQTNVAVITDTATGAQIATAVNGILAILVATGLMAAP